MKFKKVEELWNKLKNQRELEKATIETLKNHDLEWTVFWNWFENNKKTFEKDNIQINVAHLYQTNEVWIEVKDVRGHASFMESMKIDTAAELFTHLSSHLTSLDYYSKLEAIKRELDHD